MDYENKTSQREEIVIGQTQKDTLPEPKDFSPVPWLWPSSDFWLIAGGPSLLSLPFPLDLLRRRDRKDKRRVIAINNSYLLCPWADVLFFQDSQWYEWHKGREEFRGFGGVIVTTDEYCLGNDAKDDDRIAVVRNKGPYGISWEADGIRTGYNSGYGAINVAILMGAKNVYLLGYDMGVRRWKEDGEDGRMHWHEGHPIKQGEDVYEKVMLPAFDSMKREL